MRNAAMRRRALFAGVAMLGPGIRPARAAAAEIVITDMEFGPAELRVSSGTMVTWQNRDDSPHNIVSAAEPRLFRSRLMENGEHFSFAFEKPGRFEYYCALHPHMTGVVVVA